MGTEVARIHTILCKIQNVVSLHAATRNPVQLLTLTNTSGTMKKAGKDPNEKGKLRKLPFDIGNLTEEDKANYFYVDEIAPGKRLLKVKPNTFEKPIVEGEPCFLAKESTYRKQKRESLAFDEDF